MNKTTTKGMMIVQRQTILSKKSKYNYKRQSSSHKLGETYAKINNTETKQSESFSLIILKA